MHGTVAHDRPAQHIRSLGLRGRRYIVRGWLRPRGGSGAGGGVSGT